MSNLFYNHNDSVPAPQSRGTSQLVRNEFDLIQAGFDLLGQNFAGFTGAVLISGTDGGAVNAYTVTPATAITSYGTKMLVVFAPTITNTGAVTLNISGLGEIKTFCPSWNKTTFDNHIVVNKCLVTERNSLFN